MENSELRDSRLKVKHLLESGTLIYHYKKNDGEFANFFKPEKDLVCYYAIGSPINKFDIEYKEKDWSLFLDSSKTNFKDVLLYNWNTCASLPVAHSVRMKKTYEKFTI